MTSETVLRTGVLFKKGSGTGPFGRRNWKPRYFVLTPRKLTYYTYEDGELKGEVDLTGCTDQSIEVMPADSMKTGSSASTIWRIAINGADRRLIVAAGTEMEMNDWVEQFLVAFHMSSGQPMPQRRSLMQAPGTVPVPGAIANTQTEGDMTRNSITDFQNFAAARRSVGGAARASLGQHQGLEFRLSDEHERLKQAEQLRLQEQRQLAETEAERLREEELLQAHMRSQAEERRKQKELLEVQQRAEYNAEQQRQDDERMRVEALLEEQRRLKREQHERDRQEAERQLRELELQEQELRDELEIERHLEAEREEVEIHRRPIAHAAPPSPARAPVVAPPSTPSPPPRSSLIGDAKKDAMLRQQTEHNKRREATLKEQQEQMRQDFLAQQQTKPSTAAPPATQTSVEF